MVHHPSRAAFGAILAALCALLIAASAADAASPNLATFSLALDGGPQIAVPDLSSMESSTSSCTTSDVDESETCTVSVGPTTEQTTMTGSVRSARSGAHPAASGTATFDCDDTVSAQITVNIDAALLDDPSTGADGGGGIGSLLQSLTGSGAQTCSFSVDLGPAGSVTGTTSGAIQLVNDAAGNGIDVSGHATVSVVSASGEFNGEVGSGSVAEDQDVPLDDATDNLDAPSTTTTGLVEQALTPTEKMVVRLRTGSALPALVVPGSMSAGTSAAVSVAAKPKARCSVTATRGATKIAIGSGRATKRSGLVRIAHPATARLAAGRWSVVATCGTQHSAARVLRVS